MWYEHIAMTKIDVKSFQISKAIIAGSSQYYSLTFSKTKFKKLNVLPLML
jgi:hypothetical protein